MKDGHRQKLSMMFMTHDGQWTLCPGYLLLFCREAVHSYSAPLKQFLGVVHAFLKKVHATLQKSTQKSTFIYAYLWCSYGLMGNLKVWSTLGGSRFQKGFVFQSL